MADKLPVPRGAEVRAIKKRAARQDLRLQSMTNVPRDMHVEARIAMIAKLAMMGYSNDEIGAKLSIGAPAVAAHLTTIRRRWLESSLISYDTMKAGELAKINEIERQQWDEIEALRVEDDEEKRRPWWPKRNNAAYERVMWCVEQRCKLFGLYAPQEVISWKAEAAQAGYDPDTIYRILVHEMSTIIDGTAKPVNMQPESETEMEMDDEEASP